ncbi:hypothetical protein D9M68_612420 [compost metagenome]
MGTYSKSNFGKISGKVGEGVASNWRKIKVLKSLPEKSKKPIPVSRLAVNAKFALSAAQLSPIKDLLNLGFGDKKLGKLTGYNAAVRAFLNEAIIGDYPDFGVDYSKIRMSKGSLIQADVSIVVQNDIVLSWPADLNSMSSFADDRMMFVIYNQNRNSYLVNDASTRSDLSITIPFRGRPNDVLHVWSFCTLRDQKAVSSSVYVGTVTIPV